MPLGMPYKLIMKKILSLLFLTFCALPASLMADSNVVKIVSNLPRTGSSNSQTTAMVNGMRMAIEQRSNKAGKFTVKFEDWDDASPERGNWDPALEAANAERAINDPQVIAFLGPYNSGAAKISMPKLNAARLLMVSPGNTWPGLTKKELGEANEPDIYRPSGKISYFRVVPTDDIQGAVGAEWAKELGATKVYVLHDRELYGRGVATIFQQSAKQLGIEVVGFDGIEVKASNYRSLAVKIRSKGANFVYFGGTTQTNAGQLVKDLRASGLKIPIMVPDGCFENAFIEAAGKQNVEGTAYITFGGVPAKELKGRGQKFYADYKARYGIEPESYAAYGFETADVTMEALSKLDTFSREALIEQVAQTKDFDGVLGKWSFDAQGDTTLRIMSGSTVKNGEFSFVKLLGTATP